MKILVVVDMQNDFITGSLGTEEAVKIVDRVAEKMENFQGKIICTRDTHFENYLDTSEGKKLPVKHCIRGTEGHRLCPQVAEAAEARRKDPGQGDLRLQRSSEDCGRAGRRDAGVGGIGGIVYGYLCDFQCASAESVLSGNTDPGGCFRLRGSYAGKP